MITLYIDTSSNYLHVALLNNINLIDSLSIKFEKDLSKYALSYIDKLLKNNNIIYDDIKKIIVINGPGSFTGVRIGLTIAKTIAWAKKIEIVPISSIKAMALSSPYNIQYAIPVIDARRGYVYGAIYDKKNNTYILNEKYVSLKSLLASIKSLELIDKEYYNKLSIISNDKIDTEYNQQKYIPDFVNIIKNTINAAEINPHLIDANYLKLTEAEERKNDS